MGNRFCFCCCGPDCDCRAWSFDFVKDYHDQVDSVRYGEYLAIRFYVGDQTGFGHTYGASEPTLEHAILSRSGSPYTHATAVGIDASLPSDEADAAAKYATWPKAGIGGAVQHDLISIMPASDADYLVMVVRDTSVVSAADDYTFWITRGGVDSANPNWSEFFTRTSEGVFESIAPISTPDYSIDLSDLIERPSSPDGSVDLDFGSSARVRLELFTRSGIDEDVIYDYRHSIEEVHDIGDWPEITAVPSGIRRMPGIASPSSDVRVRHPDLAVGMKYIYSEGTLGRVIHSQGPIGTQVEDTVIGYVHMQGEPLRYMGELLKFYVRGLGVETRGGFMMDQSPPMTCAESAVHDVTISDSDAVYMRVTVDRGHTSLRTLTIQQVFNRRDALRDTCPHPPMPAQDFFPGFTPLNHYVAEVSLPGEIAEMTRLVSYNGKTSTDINSPMEPEADVPGMMVEFEFDSGSYYTVANSVVATPPPWRDSIMLYMDSGYNTNPPWPNLSSLNAAAPDFYYDDTKIHRGYFHSDRMHFWYTGTEWEYRGQDQVHVRSSAPDTSEISDIVELLANGGEYWFRTDCNTYKSIDSTGAISPRIASEFVRVAPYVWLRCMIRGGAGSVDETTVVRNLTAPSNYADQLVTGRAFASYPSLTRRMRFVKLVERWDLNESPEFTFTIADFIPEDLLPDQLDRYEYVNIVRNTRVERQQLSSSRRYDVVHECDSYSFRDVEITLRALHV